jgi:hypothetical protein
LQVGSIGLGLVFGGSPNELEQFDSPDPPLAGRALYSDRDCNIVTMAVQSGEMPPPWVTHSLLLPLVLLMLTGLCLFVLPYAAR